MAKFTLTLTDEHHQALIDWADELGSETKSSLAAFIVRSAIERRYPDRFPQPDLLDESSDGLGDLLLNDMMKVALNLNGGGMTAEVFKMQAARGHFTRWRNNYDERIEYFSRRQDLTWEQAFILLSQRQFPYTREDFEWAKSQAAPLLTRDEFLRTKPFLESGCDPAVPNVTEEREGG